MKGMYITLFGPSITRNLITRVLTICHVKALEQKRFNLRSLSLALRNFWLLLVVIYCLIMMIMNDIDCGDDFDGNYLEDY